MPVKEISHDQRKKNKAEKQKLEKEFLKLPDLIESAENKLEQLHDLMSAPDFYEQGEQAQQDVFSQVKSLESGIDKHMSRWQEVEQLLAEIES